MSPQTSDGPDTTDYANEATERELREDTFMDGLPYGGAQWNGANNSGISVPIYLPGPTDAYAG